MWLREECCSRRKRSLQRCTRGQSRLKPRTEGAVTLCAIERIPFGLPSADRCCGIFADNARTSCRTRTVHLERSVTIRSLCGHRAIVLSLQKARQTGHMKRRTNLNQPSLSLRLLPSPCGSPTVSNPNQSSHGSKSLRGACTVCLVCGRYLVFEWSVNLR